MVWPTLVARTSEKFGQRQMKLSQPIGLNHASFPRAGYLATPKKTGILLTRKKKMLKMLSGQWPVSSTISQTEQNIIIGMPE